MVTRIIQWRGWYWTGLAMLGTVLGLAVAEALILFRRRNGGRDSDAGNAVQSFASVWLQFARTRGPASVSRMLVLTTGAAYLDALERGDLPKLRSIRKYAAGDRATLANCSPFTRIGRGKGY